MGLANIGIPSMILILVLALIIFGPNKLPEIGKAAGSTLKEVKKATTEVMDDKPEKQTQKIEETKTEELAKNLQYIISYCAVFLMDRAKRNWTITTINCFF